MMLLQIPSGQRACLTVFCLCAALTTHGQTAEDLVKQWGAATNGLRLGLNVHLKDSWGRERTPECIVYIQNVSSNRLAWGLTTAGRETVRLFSPSGEVAVCSGPSAAKNFKRRPVYAHPPGGIIYVASFSLTNLFDLKTNGIYTLVVSVRATTNVIHGRRNPFYFVLPPVTNTFELRLYRDK